MRHNYVLCYDEPVPISEVKSAFFATEAPVAVLQLMENAFALSSDLSPSKLRFTLECFYSGEDEVPVPPRSFALCVARTGSEVSTYHFDGWPNVKPE